MTRPPLPVADCQDCGVRPGRYHEPGGDVERCPDCGAQLVQCVVAGRHAPPHDDREPWTGVWPGVEQCRELGLWARQVPGQGGSRAAPATPEPPKT
jgi:hypothetical protein